MKGKQKLTCTFPSAIEGVGEGEGEEGLFGEISCALRMGEVGDSGFLRLPFGFGVDT